jgi:hypothetical protein
MADSAEKNDEPQADKPSEALVVVKNVDGTTRLVPRTAGGTFAKKPRPMVPATEFTRQERKALMKIREGEGISEYMEMHRSMLRLAQYEPAPKEPWDSKLAMAKVKAAEWIRLSGLGKPSSSEQDLERITTQPVKTIIVVSPELMNPKVVDADKVVEKPKQPSFAVVTGVTTNPKK